MENARDKNRARCKSARYMIKIFTFATIEISLFNSGDTWSTKYQLNLLKNIICTERITGLELKWKKYVKYYIAGVLTTANMDGWWWCNTSSGFNTKLGRDYHTQYSSPYHFRIIRIKLYSMIFQCVLEQSSTFI